MTATTIAKAEFEFPKFDAQERAILGTASKNHKFKTEGSLILYPKTTLEKLRTFDKCHRFLQDLKATLSDDPEKNASVISKLNSVLGFISPHADSAAELLFKWDYQIEFGRSRLQRKMESLAIAQSESINTLASFVYSTGMEVKQVNPNETQGIT